MQMSSGHEHYREEISSLHQSDRDVRLESNLLNPTNVLCSRCRLINFDYLFRSQSVPELGTKIVNIGPKPAKTRMPKCPICRMLYNTSPAYGRKYSLHVRLFQTIMPPGPPSRQRGPTTREAPESFLSVLRCNSRLRYDYSVTEEIRHGGIIGYMPLASPESCSIRPIQERIVDYSFIKDQLKCCRANHESCSKVASPPTNLTHLKFIDCIEGKLVRGDLSDQYMTLSYVWGRQSEVTVDTTPSTFRLDVSPLTVRDAAKVVRNLGRRLLWVDRHCIDQSNETERDLLIRNMDNIYEHSEATIVALQGSDAEAGLPGVSEHARLPQLKVEIAKGVLISSCPPLTSVIADSKWNTRGWTYQEARLSRRCLFFSESQVYFACRQGVRSEAIPLDSSTSTVAKLLNDASLNAQLFGQDSSIAQGFHFDRLEYTKRDLTKPEDILDAFTGVIRRSAFMTLGGIPLRLMESELDMNIGLSLGFLWTRRPSWTQSAHLLKTGSSLSQRRSGFPTWSWTSLIAEIYQDNYGLQSSYGQFIHEIPAQFPENEAHIAFALRIDGNEIPLKSENAPMFADIELRNVRELSVDGEFVILRCRSRQPSHEWYLIGGDWRYFQPDVWDVSREQSWPGQSTETDQATEKEALVLVQWTESQKRSRVRLLLMLLEWVGHDCAKRRGMLTSYRDEFSRTMVMCMPRTRRKFILQ